MKKLVLIGLACSLFSSFQAYSNQANIRIVTDEVPNNFQIDLDTLLQQKANQLSANVADGYRFIESFHPPELNWHCGIIASPPPTNYKIHYTLAFVGDVEIWTPIDGTLVNRSEWRFVD